MTSDSGGPNLRATQEQFARQAHRYASSTLHARGETLSTILRLAAVQPHERALDVGTGAGFTAFVLAPVTRLVLAFDPTREMLEEARRLAGETRVSGRLEWALAAAEALPLTSGSVDLVACRFAAHHFHDLPGALRQFARVLRPGGRAIICDVVAPEPPHLVDLMNHLERKRDPTHVRNYPLSRWKDELLPAAGLLPVEIVPGKNPQLFSEWVHRSGTPAAVVEELIGDFSAAKGDARRAFDIRWEGAEIYFSWDNAVILTKPAE